MAEQGNLMNVAEEKKDKEKDSGSSGRTRDEVALEMMKFIAVTTGYGRGGSGAGFTGKGAAKTPEEYAESLLQLFDRCRNAVGRD